MPDLVDLAAVKDALNIDQGDTTHDPEIQRYIAAATPQIEYITGPVLPRPVIETHRCWGSSRIVLRQPPVLSVNSVVEYLGLSAYTLTAQAPGTTLNNYGYVMDFPETGVLRRVSSVGTEMSFLGNAVVVGYTAGLVSIPPDVYLAALEDIRGLYQQSQQGGGGRRYGGGGEDSFSAGPILLFPRVQAILERAVRTQSIG